MAGLSGADERGGVEAVLMPPKPRSTRIRRVVRACRFFPELTGLRAHRCAAARVSAVADNIGMARLSCAERAAELAVLRRIAEAGRVSALVRFRFGHNKASAMYSVSPATVLLRTLQRFTASART
jgi:hypothetical protein